jgi:hypothetical protein
MKTEEGFNDLASTHPDLLREWHPTKNQNLSPTGIVAGTNKKIWWICKLGHEWQAVGASRLNGTGCPTCSGLVTLSGFNDLVSLYPAVAKEWHPTKNLPKTSATQSPGSGTPVWWLCGLGHEWKAGPYPRVNGAGCPVCSGRTVWRGFNDLATTHPILAKQIIGLNPKKLIAGSNKKVKWKCSEGHNWIASIHSRSSQSMQRGCPTCAPSGFDPNEKGYLYFLSHSKWQMLQVGITNYPEKRIKSHRKLGWKLVEIRGPMDGHLTQQWETAILRMLKAKGADLSNSKIAGKFDGYSEAWSKSTFEVKSIKELMRLTEEYEENKSKF